MHNNHDIVQVKVDQPKQNQASTSTSKALQMNIDRNKTVIVYNRVNNYILTALLEAVFKHDN
ncbi:hypothetical protein FEZ51_07400 [Pediococcus stilesii]|uniref:Uncharacterized protein n=2 Tax=Pediococcus stilesii TaxID=331679 RepID=A0A5R9BV05_9LACO|nr:hypothetical protein [Pediococcus stilesii]TLQ03831.1 hypothetical protein FEZ51_07400 [Pediococcus stilesii]